MSAVSSSPYGAPLDLSVRPSRIVATLLLLLHVTALVACEQLPVAIAYRGILILGVLSAFFWNAWLYVRRTLHRLHWSPEEGWTLTDRKGTRHAVELLPEAYLSQWLVVAHFKDGKGGRHTVMLAQDSVRPEGFRRLKVLLRYGTPKA